MSHIIKGFQQAQRRQAKESRAQREASSLPIDVNDQQPPPAKRVKSPANSDGGRPRDPEKPPSEEPPSIDPSADFTARPPTKGKLWTEGEPPLPRSAAAGQQSQSHQRNAQNSSRSSRRGNSNKSGAAKAAEDEDAASVTRMIAQPDTRPISQQQLVAEVKGIYSGLLMVEAKCIEVDTAQSAQPEAAAKLGNDQWQALIALHRTLLHEHHDFFLASQHPSATFALRRLASKYAMPARMWRHGIHTFLELLRHRLPASLEHMTTFINLSYSMMALLYETVPVFKDTWIECLGDLGRYRMAIEEENARDRDIWATVSRQWYSQASDRAPTTGRLHHHLAILARPNIVKQLALYTKSLCVSIPFKSTRESVRTLFDPVLEGTQNRLQPVDLAFVKAHGILFIITNTDEKEKRLPQPVQDMWADYDIARSEFLAELDNHIARRAQDWMETGACIALANCNSLLEYGKTEGNGQGGPNPIMAAILPRYSIPPPDRSDIVMENTDAQHRWAASRVLNAASEFTSNCDAIVSKRYGDHSILPYFNVRLFFLNYMASRPDAMRHIEASVPWSLIALTLNSLSIGFEHHDRLESLDFPQPSVRPFPEDWSLRGLLWTPEMFPEGWFGSGDELSDDDERLFELPSMAEYRRERVLWLGVRLASHGKWLQYDSTSKRFKAAPEFDTKQETSSAKADTLATTWNDSTSTIDAGTKTWSDDKSGSDVSEGDAEPMVVEEKE